MKNYNNLITKYRKNLEIDPKSKSFAPLAEIYRKVGMVDEALAILKKGLVYYPNFAAAVMLYGQILIENDQADKAYRILKPQLSTNGDNIKFLKIYADLCFKQNGIIEALNTYKRILFISPRDIVAQDFVKKYDDFDSIVQDNEEVKTFDISNLDDEVNNWNSLSLVPEHEPIEEIAIVEPVKEVSQIFSHTLVDLYIKQGAKKKALEILEAAAIDNPEDKKIENRIAELKLDDDLEVVGHDNLMKAFDESSKKYDEKPQVETQKVTMAYELFQTYIRKRSQEVLNG